MKLFSQRMKRTLMDFPVAPVNAVEPAGQGVYLLPLLAMLVRVLWLGWLPADPIEPVDAEGFHLLAVNVLAGRGFAIGWEPPFCPTAIRTPLYPLFLMGSYLLLGAQPAHAVRLQVLLEALTTALVIRLGRDRGGNRAGALAGLLYAFNGTTQRYTGYLLSEMLLLPLIAAALLLTARALRRPTPARVASSALFWGLALLTKPNVQFLVIAVGLLVTARQVTHDALRITHHTSRVTFYVSRFTLFWLVLAGVVFPWLLRNRLALGRWLLSTAFAENVARVSAVATLAEVNGVLADPWTETWEYLYGQIVSQAGAQYGWEPQEIASLPCAEGWRRQQQIAEVAREIVRQHPREAAAAHLWGVTLSLLDPGHRLWYRVLTGREWSTTGVVDNIWARLAWSLERNAWGDALRVFWQERGAHIPLTAALVWWGLLAGRGVVWGLGARGLARLRRRPWDALLLAGTVGYLLLLPGPIAYDRFYVPAVPAVVVVVAVGSTEVLGNNCSRMLTLLE